MTIKIRTGRGTGGDTSDKVVRLPRAPVVATTEFGSGWYHAAALAPVAEPKLGKLLEWRLVPRS